jgi:hypothetical protein
MTSARYRNARRAAPTLRSRSEPQRGADRGLWSGVALLIASVAYVLGIYSDTWGSVDDYLTALIAGFTVDAVLNWALLPMFLGYRERKTELDEEEAKLFPWTKDGPPEGEPPKGGPADDKPADDKPADDKPADTSRPRTRRPNSPPPPPSARLAARHRRQDGTGDRGAHAGAARGAAGRARCPPQGTRAGAAGSAGAASADLPATHAARAGRDRRHAVAAVRGSAAVLRDRRGLQRPPPTIRALHMESAAIPNEGGVAPERGVACATDELRASRGSAIRSRAELLLWRRSVGDPAPAASVHGLRTDRPLRVVRGDLVVHGEESPCPHRRC